MKIVIENNADVHFEDGNQAMIAEVSSNDNEIFIRLHSWDENKHHLELKGVLGNITNGVTDQKIKITVEVT